MGEILRDTIGLIECAAEHRRPVIVGIDGRSGAGKSTFAAVLAEAISGQIVEGDAFFAGRRQLAVRYAGKTCGRMY